jgi:hypothetical protein
MLLQRKMYINEFGIRSWLVRETGSINPLIHIFIHIHAGIKCHWTLAWGMGRHLVTYYRQTVLKLICVVLMKLRFV